MSDINETRIFWIDVQKLLISNFMNIHPVGAELFHADRRADMMKLIVDFHNFEKAPKNVINTGSWIKMSVSLPVVG